MSDEDALKPVAEPTAPVARSLHPDTKISDLSVGELSALLRTEVSREVASQFSRLGSLAGSHVNSGPPGFVNGGGHANFDPASRTSGGLVRNPGTLAGSHVNSGPPGFVNGGGHANFDPASRTIGGLVSNPGSLAGSHVNSGPPGFVNGGGHANFDPGSRDLGTILTRVTLADGSRVDLPAAGPVDLRIRGVHITR
jgi:hypothetical protein